MKNFTFLPTAYQQFFCVFFYYEETDQFQARILSDSTVGPESGRGRALIGLEFVPPVPGFALPKNNRTHSGFLA